VPIFAPSDLPQRIVSPPGIELSSAPTHPSLVVLSASSAAISDLLPAVVPPTAESTDTSHIPSGEAVFKESPSLVIDLGTIRLRQLGEGRVLGPNQFVSSVALVRSPAISPFDSDPSPLARFYLLTLSDGSYQSGEANDGGLLPSTVKRRTLLGRASLRP